MNKTVSTLALTLGLYAGSSLAGTISYDAAGIGFSDTNWDTTTVAFPAPTAGGDLILPLFDDVGGTLVLQKVELIGEAWARGLTTITNTGATTLTYGTPEDDITGSIVMTSTVGGLSITLNPIATENIGIGTIASGDPAVEIEVGGGLSGTGVFDDDSATWLGLAAQDFVGPGGFFTLNALAVGAQTVSLSGQGAVSVDLEAAADASVIYTYDAQEVPEPTSLALIGIGLLGAAGATRLRKSR